MSTKPQQELAALESSQKALRDLEESVRGQIADNEIKLVLLRMECKYVEMQASKNASIEKRKHGDVKALARQSVDTRPTRATRPRDKVSRK